MSIWTLPLAMVTEGDVGRVGAKAARLGRLKAAGFPVPDGFCVTTAAWERALGGDLEQLDAVRATFDLRAVADTHAAADALAPLAARLTVPPEVTHAVEVALAALAPESAALAVRSSTRAEDGVGVSFAGQYTTVLGVRDVSAVVEAILTCWRSYFSAGALAARAVAGAAARHDAMAVLVQRLIDAECAGVCFTVDPIQRRRDLIVINAAWGLGSGVVDGSVAADTWRLNRATLVAQECRVVDKPEQWTLAPEGGVRRGAVPGARRRAACLPRRWRERVAEMGLAAERLFGWAQDVEWAIADEQVWLLQSRAVTGVDPALARVPPFAMAWEDETERRRSWMLLPSYRGEFPPPLQQDYDAAAVGAWTDASAISGGPRFMPVRMCCGRGYVTRLDDEENAGDQRVRAAALADLAVRLREAGATFWDYWGPEVVTAVARLHDVLQTVDETTDAALAETVDEAFGLLRRHWAVHALLAEGEDLLLAPYYTAYATARGPASGSARTEAVSLLVGEDTVFTRLVDTLFQLAELARAEPAVTALVKAHPRDTLSQLAAMPAAAAFGAAFAHLLATYGERTGTGRGAATNLATPTWREDPLLVLRCVAAYLDPAAEAPEAARTRVRATQAARFAALCDAGTNTAAVAELRRWWPYARRVATWLEDHNHYIDQASYGQLRLLLLAAGRRLASHGTVEMPDDVFWLRRADIVTALRAAQPVPLAATVAQRKVQHAQWAVLEVPVGLGIPEATLPPRPPLEDEADPLIQRVQGQLAGQAASPGRRRGRARVIPATTSLPTLLAGEVLVAENAGPLWTPLFPLLGGLILEQGSVTQHAATTAREYAVPAVLGVAEATRLIPEGAWVIVDGDRGTVEFDPILPVQQTEDLP